MTHDAPDPGAHRTVWNDRRLSLTLFLIVVAMLGFEAVRFVTAIHTRNKIDASAETLNIVRDVVDPGGKRYAAAAAAQVRVLAQLNDAQKDTSAVAVYCARFGGDVATIKACVDSEFAKLHPPAPPTTTTTTARPGRG